ncbi:MAG TPA: DUF192 domain-containing protein [Geomonas sp.]|nr:DUF192 domain-containing protein [Geomonas sp.]
MRAVNTRSGQLLAANLSVAATFLSRSKGLLGRQRLSAGEGLLIAPCNGVHTFFMKFPIDVIFLDKENRIIGAREHLPPYRITRVLFSCVRVLELPAGTLTASGTVPGDRLLIG